MRNLTRRFGDAFKLMKYQNDTGTAVEWLWNSRDGVTPFGIIRRDVIPPVSPSDRDAMLYHVHWHEDVFVPNFVPPVGMRIFVDMTMDKALALARDQVDRSWESGGDYQMKDHSFLGPLGRDGAADHLAGVFFDKGDQPAVEIVTEELHAHFARLAREEPFRP